MINFYGGPNGKSFTISKIFSSYYKNPNASEDNSMEGDIAMGWRSPVSVGSFVVISYGQPGSTEYIKNWNETDWNHQNDNNSNIEDKNKKKPIISYNSTLWEKIYDKNEDSNNGLNYRLIMSMAGLTPRISVDKETLNANKDPTVEIDPNSDLTTNPKIIFGLPRSQVISVTNTSISSNIDPYITLNNSDINNPVINFYLPRSQQIGMGTFTPLDAGKPPTFSITYENNDVDKPRINLGIPQSQIMEDPETNEIGPKETPNVILTKSNNDNNIKLTFNLPRSVRFNFGEDLNTAENTNVSISSDSPFASYEIGDYYINKTKGYIYGVESKTNTSVNFGYIGSIQQPLPNVSSIPINPYKEVINNGNTSFIQNNPSVEKTSSDDGWDLKFKLPNLPNLQFKTKFVGPLDQKKVEGKAVESTHINETTTNFTVEIPRGSRIFYGNNATITPDSPIGLIEDALMGDYYLNKETFDFYIQNVTEGVWTHVCNLRGGPGEPLRIVRSYKIVGNDTHPEAGIIAIESDPKNDNITPNQIFVVTFTNEGTPSSYFYFKLENGDWDWCLLTGTSSGGTGNIEDFIFNEYQESKEPNAITDKTYSVDYINKLIGGTIDSGNMDKTAFSKDQIYYLLSWGTFEDAINGIDIPIPENKDTLSAEEVLKLISWGEF